eukprot:tig00020965_g16871.t1
MPAASHLRLWRLTRRRWLRANYAALGAGGPAAEQARGLRLLASLHECQRHERAADAIARREGRRLATTRAPACPPASKSIALIMHHASHSAACASAERAAGRAQELIEQLAPRLDKPDKDKKQKKGKKKGKEEAEAGPGAPGEEDWGPLNGEGARRWNEAMAALRRGGPQVRAAGPGVHVNI